MLLTMTHQSTWLPLELSLYKGRGQKEEGLGAPVEQPLAPGCQKRKQEAPVQAGVVGRRLRTRSWESQVDWARWQRGERVSRLLFKSRQAVWKGSEFLSCPYVNRG